ncbi:extracellular solute-binding protein [Microlunatus sp. GCM10028923]|uniref:extracellular solute-binding protein n=1 Tax=Microlunatus sp. GCM10028923 TaxID=3273400 RepID=UPI00360C853E
MNEVSRRSVLRLLGAGTATATLGPYLAGCSAAGGAAGTGNSGREAAPWPTFVKAVGPTPDLPATLADSAVNGYYTYPSELMQSVAEPPGDGSKISAQILTYSPPPNPASANKLWAAINQALNVDLQLNLVPAAEYAQKLAAVTATNDLPDTMLITSMPRAKQFVAAKCADLTEYLSGDAIKEYPNLAAIPQYAWEAMGHVDGGIYGIPLPRARAASVFHVNRDQLDGVGATDDWTRDQFVAAMKACSAGGRYGLGTWAGGGYAVEVFAGAFGAPNGWRVDGGTFTPAYAAPEYKEAIAFARDLVKSGTFHPNSNTASQNDIMTQYYAATLAAVPGNFMNYANGVYFDRVGGRFTTDVSLPIGGQHSYLGSGIFGYTVFKKADPERIKMLLRICNYLAAPYGTVEYETVSLGLEGEHFTRTSDGLTKTALAETENENTVPVKYIADAMEFIQVPGNRKATQRGFEVYEKVVALGTPNPSLGLDSETADKDSVALGQKLSDLANGIIAGRNDLAEWDAAVQTYLRDGGQKMADEFAAASAAR